LIINNINANCVYIFNDKYVAGGKCGNGILAFFLFVGLLIIRLTSFLWR